MSQPATRKGARAVFSRPHLPTLDTGLLVRPLLYRKCPATHARAGDDVVELSYIVRC